MATATETLIREQPGQKENRFPDATKNRLLFFILLFFIAWPFFRIPHPDRMSPIINAHTVND